MSGNKKVLLDTNVLIYASKALLDLEKLSKRYDVFFVSIITYMEIYAYDFVNSAELDAINQIFEALEIISIDLELSNQAILYRKNKIKKIKLPDALVLASAKIVNADLLTNNHKDFVGIDNQLFIQKLDDFFI
jgi:predicted nucleic acid-binding protein